jgi:long-subunit fatty acid transport protein
VILFLILSLPASALTDEEVFRDFRFNLINPGARARGIGGAFLSLADDATAAQANPAGLSFLLRTEYFAELRVYDNAARSSVITETLPTGIDTFVARGTDLDDGASLSFLSAVIAKKDWSIGFSRQELINIQNSTLSSFAFTFEDTPGVFLAAGTGNIDVLTVNWNVSAGYRISDRWSLGATLAYSTLDVDSTVTNTIVDTENALAQQAEPVLEPTLDLQTTIKDDDDDVTYSIGMLYRVVDKWSIGAVYRRGPRFSVTEEITSVPTGLDVFGVAARLGTDFVDRFSLPDTIGVGGSWNASPRITVATDIEFIEYSNLLDGYVPGVNVLTQPDAEFTVDDATDIRAGLEYVFPNTNKKMPPIALRGGVYIEESSEIRAKSTGTGSFATEEVFRDSGREEHLTLGLGFVMKRYKLDLAADLANSDNEYLISFIYKSKK